MKIPEGAKIEVAGMKVTVSGPKGSLIRDFKDPGVTIKVKEGSFEVEGPKAISNTIASHIRNMSLGVVDGYSKKMKIVYSHFPISIEIKGKEILIKNFLGEKQPRHSKIMGSVKVEAKGQELLISGISKDDVGQTAANIRSASKIRKRDSRVFQDGFYEIFE